MCGRAGCGTDTAVQATIQFMVESQVSLDVLKNFLELFTPNDRVIGDRVADVFLYSRSGRM
jgi:hypothetical protein